MPVLDVLLLFALPLPLTLQAFVELPALTERNHTLDQLSTRNLESLYPHTSPYGY